MLARTPLHLSITSTEGLLIEAQTDEVPRPGHSVAGQHRGHCSSEPPGCPGIV
jgi:hypothetical protein